jgi:hypothetical protein
MTVTTPPLRSCNLDDEPSEESQSFQSAVDREQSPEEKLKGAGMIPVSEIRAKGQGVLYI